MPNRSARGQRTPAANGRAQINLGAIAGAGGGEDAVENPDFQKAPGDINPSYTGDPSSLSGQRFLDDRSWLDKLINKPNKAEALNNQYLLQTALAKYGQQLGQQTAMQNVGQVNPDFLAVSNKQPVEHDFNDENFNANTVMPFTGNSLGSQQGNATYAGESGMKDLADKSALQQLVNAQKVTQQGYPAAQKNAQAMYYAGQGINPKQADVLSPPTQAAYTAGRQASAAGSMVQKEKFLAEQPEAYETASKESQNNLAALNDPNFTPSFITGRLAQNLHPAEVNKKLQQVNVNANEAVYTPTDEYHGQSVVASQVPKPPLQIPDGKGGFMAIPQSGLETVHNITPAVHKTLIPIGPKANPNPPAILTPSQDRSTVIPSRVTQLQAPTNQLDLSMNPDVIPAKTAPQANTVSPANLLLQYLKHKGKSIFDIMTSTAGPTR